MAGVEDPKLNGLAGLAVSFAMSACSEAEADDDDSIFSSFLSLFARAPKVNGDDDPELEALTVGTNPGPADAAVEEAGVAGFKKLNPPEGADGGLGAEGAAAGVGAGVDVDPFEVFETSCPGFQPDFWAISSMCRVTCCPSETSVSDRSRNGSSLTALDSALAKDVLRPLIEVQYLISASDGWVVDEPLALVAGLGSAEAAGVVVALDFGEAAVSGCFDGAGVITAGVVDDEPKANDDFGGWLEDADC